MSNIAVCPNCGGQKTVSKPPYIAGDVNAWVGSDTPLYPCPTCDGHGWIRVDSVPQGDFDNVKFVALSSMETAENLMDECTKRADRIKELETELERKRAGEHAADKEIERLLMKIFDIEGREDLVTTELEHRACAAEDRLRVVKEMRDELLEDWEAKRGAVTRLESEVRNLRTLVDMKDMRISDFTTMRDVARKARNKREDELLGIVDDLTTKNKQLEADTICFRSAVKGFRAVVGEKDLRIADLESQRDMVRKIRNHREEELLEVVDDLVAESERDKLDLELLDEMLKLVNPLIKSGAYAKPSAESRLLATQMHGLCQTVVQFRRKHNIVG